MRTLHIIAGLISLLAGAVALYSAKGSTLHKRAGLVFFGAMLVMAALGATMAALKPDRGTMTGGLLVIYMVCTSLLTVRRSVAQARGLYAGLMLFGLVLGTWSTTLYLEALASPNGRVDHLPGAPILLMSTVTLLAVLGDARLLVVGRIEAAQRIARHLWRMCYAMFMATGSFFLGQAKLFPAPIRILPLLVLPVLLVLGTMVYWLVKTLRGRRVATRAAA